MTRKERLLKDANEFLKAAVSIMPHLDLERLEKRRDIQDLINCHKMLQQAADSLKRLEGALCDS